MKIVANTVRTTQEVDLSKFEAVISTNGANLYICCYNCKRPVTHPNHRLTAGEDPFNVNLLTLSEIVEILASHCYDKH